MGSKKYGDAYDGEFFRPDAEFFRRAYSSSSHNTQGPSKKGDCFVASVVYGNKDAYEVNVLRKYRDNVLMQDELGKKFVEWYYSGGGERMSEFVRGKGRFLIPIIRKGLDFIVEEYKMKRE